MSSQSHKSLFSGAARYYKYRSPYPKELFDLIVQTFGLDGSGRLLDLGCGPGNVALGLYRYFEKVVAVDINLQMLAEGQKQAQAIGADNITWLESAAEAIGPELGRFRLVTLGRSFHWMQRERVLQRAWEVLETGGGLVVLDSATGDREHSWWYWVSRGLVLRWRTQEREVQPRQDSPEPHQAIVARSAFGDLQSGSVSFRESLRLEQVLGELYSMSGSKPERFGPNLEAFEHDFRMIMNHLEPSGRFERERGFGYIFARK